MTESEGAGGKGQLERKRLFEQRPHLGVDTITLMDRGGRVPCGDSVLDGGLGVRAQINIAATHGHMDAVRTARSHPSCRPPT
jgi:hypothetical protein